MDDETSSSDITTFSKSQLDPLDTRICQKFFTSGCQDQDTCPLKHTLDIRDQVCKYFLLHGYCYKGPTCSYLHSINNEKVPYCKNQTINSKCSNPKCKFNHNIPLSTKECVFYKEGFCKYGKFCKFKHISRKLCSDLQCEEQSGSTCELAHPKGYILEMFLQEVFYLNHPDRESYSYEQLFDLCFRCLKFGHKPNQCTNPDKNRVIRCYRCTKYGHKSNECDEMNKDCS
jgi:hypothetical protein